MKAKLLVLLLAALPALSFAAASGALCTGGSSGAVAFDAPDDPSTEFVKRDFNVQCSANVALNYSQNQVAIAVASASVKGKTYFHGSSEGGAVTRESDCPNDGCVDTDLTSKATAKLGGS